MEVVKAQVETQVYLSGSRACVLNAMEMSPFSAFPSAEMRHQLDRTKVSELCHWHKMRAPVESRNRVPAVVSVTSLDSLKAPRRAIFMGTLLLF